MTHAKTLADTLTATRFLIAIWMLWMGTTAGAPALPSITIGLVIAWMTDLVDGPLARRDPMRRHSWLGDHDLQVDMAVALSLLLYLTVSRFVPARVTLSYLALCALLLWRFRARALGMLLQAPVYGWTLYVALRNIPRYGFLMIGWILFTIIVTWPRFPLMVVPEFLQGMRDLWGEAKEEQ
ncbi:MAG: hypothetical protein ACE5NP_05585 [Anaerolineae bacterium]